MNRKIISRSLDTPKGILRRALYKHMGSNKRETAKNLIIDGSLHQDKGFDSDTHNHFKIWYQANWETENGKTKLNAAYGRVGTPEHFVFSAEN